MAKTRAATDKDDAIIAALISHSTVKAAAKACGVSERKIYTRLQDQAFKERYDNARHSLLEQSTAYLQGIVCEAIEKMREIMTDPENTAQLQLNAADCIMRNCLKLTETNDILAQITEIKKAVFPNE